MYDAAKLAFAVSPLLIVLFAYEMSAIQYAHDHDRLTGNRFEFAVMLVVFKLPGSLVIPAFTGWAGFAVIAVLDLVTIILSVREDIRNVKGLDSQE